jgi:hypothetical protein
VDGFYAMTHLTILAIDHQKRSPVLIGPAAVRFEKMSKANEKRVISKKEKQRMDEFYAKVMSKSRL